MYPAAVDYVAPASLGDALTALAEGGEDAKVIAGGQSLIPLLRLRFAAPTLLVDIRRLPGLRGIVADGRDLVIGALTRHADMLTTPVVAERFPVLAVAASQIADPQVRNMGTIGGAIAHADPEGDWASVMIALRASVTLTSPRGTRVVDVRDFMLGMFTTDLAPDEIIESIRIPGAGGRQGGDYQKLSRRVGDFASVGVATALVLRERGLLRKQTVIEQAGIALTALGPINAPAAEAEAALTGQPPSAELFARAADLVAKSIDPHDDARGSGSYKRAVVRAYVVRGLQNALSQAAA